MQTTGPFRLLPYHGRASARCLKKNESVKGSPSYEPQMTTTWRKAAERRTPSKSKKTTKIKASEKASKTTVKKAEALERHFDQCRQSLMHEIQESDGGNGT